MANIILNGKTVVTQTGNDEPVLGSNVILTNNSLASATFPAGHVIQVVNDLKTVGNAGMDADILDVTITGTTFATGYTVNTLSITPKQATSKLVLLHSGMVRINGTGGCDMYFAKNGNQILTSGGNKNAHGFVYHDTSSVNRYTQSSINDVITAGTEDSITISVVYSLYGGTLRLQHDGSCSLIVMEVEG